MARNIRDKKRTGREGGRDNAGVLPEVCVLSITAVDEDGGLIAVPVVWDKKKVPPHILLSPGSLRPAPGVDDRVLARLTRAGKHAYTALPIKILPGDTPQPVLGVYRPAGANGLIESVNRRDKEAYFVAREHSLEAAPGELVAGETLPIKSAPYGARAARITERLGPLTSARSASIIAIHAANLPTVFSKEALAEAEAAPEPARADLRAIPLITIDGEDARDFDDAVFAEPDGDGFHCIVAIADVSCYVTPASALDRDAVERGNSAYFPDRVVPMLPERLSNGLCSLKPDEDRYALVVHLWISPEGVTTRHRFERALIRSCARMTYAQVQKIADSAAPHPQITPLFAAYAALTRERDRRGALALHLPEHKIQLDASGNVRAILPKDDFESHRLIEAYMVAANVAAAEFILKHKGHGIYRVHQPPDKLKLQDLHALLTHMGYSLPKGDGIAPSHFNRVLKKALGTAEELIVHQAILRAQMQAFYAPECLGHFGLALQKYCHFTSPIRRYADLMVHREIIRILEKEPATRGEQHASIAQHISDTERKAMQAERDAMDRYRASFMADKVGEVYPGVITGVTEAGLFVTLPESGVTGYVPMRSLGNDYFHYEKKRGELSGQRSRKKYALGDALVIRVEGASGVTGSLMFVPEEFRSTTQPLTRGRGGHKTVGKGKPRGPRGARSRKS